MVGMFGGYKYCFFVLFCRLGAYFAQRIILTRRTQSPRGLRRRLAVACLLGLWVRMLPGACMSVCCECCVLSGRGLSDELITRPEESY